MKKFGIIKDELTQLAVEYGLPDDTFKNCSGRAQLLAKLKSFFTSLYRFGVIDLAWLREYYNEEDLNRQQIYSAGIIEIYGESKLSVILGDCRCVTCDSPIQAFDKASVKASGSGKVYGFGHSQIEATSRSRVIARDKCRVKAANYAIVWSYDDAETLASDYAQIFVKSAGETTLKCQSSAFVSHPNAVVEAGGYSTVHYQIAGKISLCEHAVAVDNPHAEVAAGEDLVYTRDLQFQ